MAPTATLGADPLSGPAPLTAEFEITNPDADGLTITDWAVVYNYPADPVLIGFGSGLPGEGETFQHEFTEPGVYVCTLFFASDEPAGYEIDDVTVTVLEPPSATVTADPTSGDAPLSVEFEITDVTEGDYDISGSGSWQLRGSPPVGDPFTIAGGDGLPTEGHTVPYEFTEPGTYSIALLFFGPGGPWIIADLGDYIVVSEASPTPPPRDELVSEYRLIACDQDGNRYAETTKAVGTWALALNAWDLLEVDIPVDDPLFAELTARGKPLKEKDTRFRVYRGDVDMHAEYYVERAPQTRDGNGMARLSIAAVSLEGILAGRTLGPKGRTRWSSRTPGAHVNWILNPDLTEDFDEWTFVDAGGTHSISNVRAYVGAASARVDQPQAGQDCRHTQSFTFASGYPAGSEFSFKAFHFWDSGSFLGPAVFGRIMYIEAYDGANLVATAEVTHDDDTPLDTWFPTEASIHVPNGVTWTFHVHIYHPGGTSWFQHVLALPDDRLAYFDEDSVTIVHDLLRFAQEPAHGKRDMGIVSPDSPTLAGNTQSAMFFFRDDILAWDAIRQFEELDVAVIPDWAEGPPVFQTFFPERGTDRSATMVAELGRNIVAYSHVVDGEQAADTIITRSQGGGDTRDEGIALDTSAYDTTWEKIVTSSIEIRTSRLDQFAALNLPAAKHPATLSITVDDTEHWVDTLRPGDTIRVILVEGRLDIDAPYRVTRIQVPIGTKDEGRIHLTLDATGRAARPNERKFLAAIDRRLGRIEKTGRVERPRPQVEVVTFSQKILTNDESPPFTFQRRQRVNRWIAELRTPSVAGDVEGEIYYNAATIASFTIPEGEVGVQFHGAHLFPPHARITYALTSTGAGADGFTLKGWE